MIDIDDVDEFTTFFDEQGDDFGLTEQGLERFRVAARLLRSRGVVDPEYKLSHRLIRLFTVNQLIELHDVFNGLSDSDPDESLP
jgi:hypothetical protein